jgi:hypothetical protein
MSDQDKIYFSATDPEGREILLHKSTWDHIKRGHPEIKRPSKVKSTIQHPDIILENTVRSSLIYTKESRSDLFINVIVKMDDEYNKGRVSTAHKTRKLLQGDSVWTRKK